MYKIYYPKENNAVDFYLHIIEKAAKKVGKDVVFIKNFSNITKDDILVTIDAFPAFRCILKHPKKIINWFQGIAPEEKLHFDNRNKLYIRLMYYVHSWLEWYALKHCDLCFFVSEAMHKHYEMKYGYKKNNYIIMPCFNTGIEPTAFLNEKYSKPTFLYSGNINGWQRVPEIISLFKHIKGNLISNAELNIFTPNQKEMKRLLEEQGVEAVVSYVHYSKLNDEIKKYKYGFLIREDVDVNNVATPTKMNSYLANGIIPIFSNVIGDFKEELKGLKYAVPLGTNYEGLSKIMGIEKETVSGEDVMKDFQTVFNQYYNEDYYVNLIVDMMHKLDIK